MNHTPAPDVTVLAAVADFSGIRTDVVGILLQVVFLVFFVFAVRGFIQSQWGQLIGNLAGLIFVTWVLLFPDNFQTVIGNVGQSLFGGAAG